METGKTILVIEDDPSQQYLYTTILQRAGYSVVARGEADSGLRWLEQILPDLILLDLMLPGLPGDEMLEEIRNSPNGRDVPVIIATALSDVSIEHFEEFNVALLLHKPLLPSDLVAAVNQVLINGS